MREHIEAAMSPAVAVPVTTTAMFASFMDVLPLLMQVGSFLYLLLLIGHKLWSWHKEWKNKGESKQ